MSVALMRLMLPMVGGLAGTVCGAKIKYISVSLSCEETTNEMLIQLEKV